MSKGCFRCLGFTLVPILLLAGCGGGSMSTNPGTKPGSSQMFQLTVQPTGGGTVVSNPSGINCGATCNSSFPAGTSITLTATASAGSAFVNWGGGCSGSKTCTVTLNSNMTVSATFASSPALSLSLSGTGSGTVTSNPAGISCGTTCKAAFSPGTSIALTATPAANSTFAGWSGACSGTGACALNLTNSASVTASFTAGSQSPTLTVSLAGTGAGTVTSNPAGINCGTTCSVTFNSGTSVTLTAAPVTSSTFAGWTGSCSGTGSCTVVLTANSAVGATFNVAAGINLLNHIIFLAQENRSFDHYFGQLRQWWSQNGYPDQPFDGLPQFNPTPGPAPTNPGCDPNFPPPNTCVIDSNSPTITSYHLLTQCIENPSPFWNESHNDWDYQDPTGNNPAQLNAFVWTAGYDARSSNNNYYDTGGIRAMGYYTGDDLNYYYFMASNFGTSDRWFNPAMTRTEPNREYLIAATSQGYVYPVGSNANDKNFLTATTIFQELQNAGISWKIYVNPTGTGCSGPPYSALCLLNHFSYVSAFQWGQTIPTAYPNNIGTIGPPGTCGSSPCDFENDLANGTLPQVAQIEPASDAGLDEHPSDYDNSPQNIQAGANYVAGLINNVMNSSEWSSSVFILTYDEFGGLYDHVSPQPAVSPDGIPPVDLEPPGDICTSRTGPTCDFVYTGYRVPLIVVSPYAKKNYVSHTVADNTAILKLIETRFGLSALNNRDAAQPDMIEFFDFNNPPWLTPPTPPAQNTSGACYLTHLP